MNNFDKNLLRNELKKLFCKRKISLNFIPRKSDNKMHIENY